MKKHTIKKHKLHKKVTHHTKMVVVPHKKNQYRPHLIRRHGLAAIFVIVLLLQFVYSGFQPSSILGDTMSVTPAGLLSDTNKARATEGDEPLALNSQLSRAAYLKAKDMFKQQYWAHNAPDGTQPWKWFGDVDYAYSEAGENLARGFHDNDSLVDAWLQSPSHRENVLKSTYTQVGFAVVDGELEGKSTSLVVALYGRPASQAVVAGTQTKFIQSSTAALSPAAKIGVWLQTITPATLTSVMLVMFAMMVALIAQVYRKKLPKKFQRTWYRHHAAYKAVSLAAFAVVIVGLYSGGQI